MQREKDREADDLPDPCQSVLQLLLHIAAVHHQLIRLRCSRIVLVFKQGTETEWKIIFFIHFTYLLFAGILSA